MTTVFQNIKPVDNNTLTFVVSPMRVTYVNILRRAIQTEIPILGFRADMTETGATTDVNVFKNTTPMSNEMLADRIGLLPVLQPPNAIGWKRDSVLFKLHVKNESSDVRYVTASDFECWKEGPEGSDERVMVPNTQFFQPDPLTQATCLIAVLKPMIEGQPPEEIHLEAYATLGKGREHARFNPTCQSSYGYTRDEDPARIQQLWETWLMEQKKQDPKEVEKDIDRKRLLENEFRSLEIYRCYKVDADGEPMSYDFTVESTGVLAVQNIVFEALLAVAKMADQYASMDAGDLPENVEIRPADARLKGFDFWFSGEDHTLGNLLQTWLDDNKVGRPATGSEVAVTFAGYKVPHPLRDEMVLRVGVEDGKPASARLVVAQAAKACADMFRTWASEWSAALTAEGIVLASEHLTAWEAHARAKGVEKAAAEERAKARAEAAAARGRGRGRGGPVAGRGRGK
jgi:DNA-directed RNA polymerase subunit L/DNA-directed RNA polymerase alpha subunit